MRLIFLAILLVLGSIRCLEISHWDLENANITCDGKSICQNSSRGGSRLIHEVIWRNRNCMCDPTCAHYGDCCLDSPHFVASDQRRGSASFSCVNVDSNGVYMMATCPPDWEDKAVRLNCEGASTENLFLENNKDPFIDLPITSQQTGFTYRNAFCALCNGENLNSGMRIWNPSFHCNEVKIVSKEEGRKLLVSQLKWSSKYSQWSLNNSTCIVQASIPVTVQDQVRRCIPDVIKTCSVNWTNADVRTRCEAYTLIVYAGGFSYRNPHCGICNNIPINIMGCNAIGSRKDIKSLINDNSIQGSIDIRVNEEVVNGMIPSFSILFDFEDLGPVGKYCSPGEMLDPFKKTCRKLVCEDERVFSEGVCVIHSTSKENVDPDGVTVIETVGTSEKNISEHFEECPKVKFSPLEYELSEDNSSVWLPFYKRNFQYYHIDADGNVMVCADSVGFKDIEKFGPYMSYVTITGLGVSIIFLILHLIAFMMLSELRNLSGKNLASYCLALLVAYCAFIAGQMLNIEGQSCVVAASFTQYAFLSAFSWMLVLAFDVWRSLRLATSELRVSSGRQWRKFLAYSLFAWFSPLIFVIAALATDAAPPGAVNNFFRPGFGINSCWFTSRKALLIFFGIPIIIVMVLNIVFFATSAYMIWSTTSTTRYTSSSGTRRDFRLYTRLALVMGLTWSIGLVAGYVNLEGLWYAFIALNTLQGLFIFLAFTCKEKVVRGILARCHCFGSASSGLGDSKHHLHPPSFSWSGDSDTTRKSHFASSTSDLRQPTTIASLSSPHNSQQNTLQIPSPHHYHRKSVDALY